MLRDEMEMGRKRPLNSATNNEPQLSVHRSRRSTVGIYRAKDIRGSPPDRLIVRVTGLVYAS